jgi:hypothetical protein
MVARPQTSSCEVYVWYIVVVIAATCQYSHISPLKSKESKSFFTG